MTCRLFVEFTAVLCTGNDFSLIYDKCPNGHLVELFGNLRLLYCQAHESNVIHFRHGLHYTGKLRRLLA